ncbi:MAG: circularly permuted type 2 ATP-grasp protein, partial [Frankiaceae bacterium]
GSKDTWVISPPRQASDADEPEFTRIEFTTADLPDDPPAQDPGPLGDTVVGQSQQQQQAGLFAKSPGSAELAPLGPAGLFAKSPGRRPQC